MDHAQGLRLLFVQTTCSGETEPEEVTPDAGLASQRKISAGEHRGMLAHLINYLILGCLFTGMKCYKRSDVN